MTNAVIECHALEKQYGTGPTAVRALRGVDLTIAGGEIFMVVGPSGCGKTTLISIIASILDPSSGTCRVLENEISSMSTKCKSAFRAENIGFVFQSLNLLPTLTALENAAVPLFIKHESYGAALEKAHPLLREVGLRARAEFYPAQLSGGELQRVAIARALVHEPKIVVCDEPTSALDAQTGQKVLEIMRRLARNRGLTLMIVTHDERILEFADRIGYMEDGRISRIEQRKNYE